MTGITFSAAAAENLVATYRTSDIVAQREATIERLALRPGEAVIDVGSGPGFLCESMAAAVGSAGRVLGIDRSAELVAFASERQTSPVIAYRVGDALALEAPDRSFDVAVSTQVLEYVPDTDAALAEIHRVLRPGGRCVIVDTDCDSIVWHSSEPERMLRVLEVWEGHCAHPRLPRTLASRLRSAGFTVDRVAAYPIVNTACDPDRYSYWLARLIAAYVARRGFDPQAIDAWLADLSALDRQGRYFFSLNRYVFSVSKPAGK